MKIHELITETAPLAELCERLAKSDFVCVDTEFMRENTYWPELCLVQIGNEEEAAAIDPLAPGIDLTPLWDLMCDNDEVLKVFHAGGQDVEIVYNFTGKTPQPIFDTQIAMMAISQSEQIGYANLVESWLGLTIDKGAPENLVSFCGSGVRKIGPTTFEMSATDFFPERDINVLILRRTDGGQ